MLRTAAAHDPNAAPSDALLALDAFERGSALVELTPGRLQWCSPAFETHCSATAGTPLSALEPRLPGVLAALAGLGRADRGRRGVVRWRTTPGALAGMEAQATLVRPGLAALRLLDDADDVQQREQAARRHLEDRERLLFTSRTLSVGEMASTLAHELNQPIGTIANVLRGIRTRLERAEAASEHMTALLPGLRLALDQALFAARIIARIRDYTHSRQPRRDSLELAQVVTESLALLDWELQRDSVQVQLTLPEAPSPVVGDEVMLQQLFVNLLRNALEAMRDNPADTGGGVARELVLSLTLERSGREAVLALRDNGCGLPSDANQRLFVPFQSTKPNGMGIGLNVCRSFVELHQGRLWFCANDGDDGQPARGCTFHVALPLAAGAPPKTEEN
ncbi:sensor histidine kinase [Piscinibacter sp.]|uniref:sensor histidine kinase n=1 Tax=Piscinibacter sp. TaxID=1903157 RepID=UPI002C9D4680|nr:HAMP domain-containing sensor histidine kinase [Albitalea sp.]HUG22608.1 HAMP domain-containing sensor histidine kinase [Albitalea sp.]